MNKKFIVLGLAWLLAANLAGAQPIPQNNIKAADLGIDKVGLLPGSPFYFLKEWGRGIKRVFIFDSIRRSGFDLDVLNEKAAEIQKLLEDQPINEGALAKALKNYQENVARLKTNFERLRSFSGNPNLERLLDKLAERSLKHSQLFSELIQNHQDLADRLRKVKNDLLDKVKEIAETIDAPEKFGQRIKRAFETERSELSQTRNAQQVLSELVNRLPSQAVEKIKEIITKLEQKFGTSTSATGTPAGLLKPKERKVEILDSGFSPILLRILKGDTVIWINRASSPAWPASNIHPSHAYYPEPGGCVNSKFDACHQLLPGESWSFIFDHIGIWMYHNHLNPSQRGAIEVFGYKELSEIERRSPVINNLKGNKIVADEINVWFSRDLGFIEAEANAERVGRQLKGSVVRAMNGVPGEAPILFRIKINPVNNYQDLKELIEWIKTMPGVQGATELPLLGLAE